MERVIERRVESLETAGALLSNINRSMAAMQGWVLTNDKNFITQHHNAWNYIDTNSKRMEKFAQSWDETEDYNNWSRISAQLSELRLVLAPIEKMDIAARGNKVITFLYTGVQSKAEDLLTALGGAAGPNDERSGSLIGDLRSRAISDENKIHKVICTDTWIEWAFLISGMLVAGYAARLTTRSIVPPIEAVTGVMTRLAAGDYLVDIPSTDRLDEIGAMARALLVFRDDALEKRRLHAQFANIAEYFPGVLYRRSQTEGGETVLNYVIILLKRSSVAGFHPTTKHNAAKAV